MVKVLRKLETIITVLQSKNLSHTYHCRIAQLKGRLETNSKDCDGEIGGLQLVPYIETPEDI